MKFINSKFILPLGFGGLGRLMSNQAALMLQYGVNAILPILLVPHVVHSIGLHEFGLLSIALSFANYGALVVNYGFKLSAPPKIVQAPSLREQSEVVRATLYARLLLAILMLLVIGASVSFLSLIGSAVSPPQVIMLVSLPIATCFNMSWYLQALEKFGWIALASVVAVALALAIGFGLLDPSNPHASLWAALALSAGPVLSGLLTGAIGLRTLVTRTGTLGWHPPWTELKAGWPFFVSQLLAGLYGASGVIIVGLIAGTSAAGSYSAMERVSTALANGCLLVHTAAYPQLSAHFQNDRRKYIRHLILVLVVYWLGAATISLGAIIFWPDVQNYVFGQISPENGRILASALLLIVLMIFGTIYTGYLAIAGRTKELLPLTLKLLILSLIVGVPSVWLWGAAGWFMTLSLSHIVVGVIGWREWRRAFTKRALKAP